MNSKCRTWAIISLIAAMAVGASACRTQEMSLPSIRKEDVPQAIRDFSDNFAVKPDGGSYGDVGLVWHVSTPKDGRHLVACTFYEMGDRKAPVLWVASFPIDGTGDVAAFDDHSISVVGFSSRRRSQGDFSYGSVPLKDGSRQLGIQGGGLCLNANLAKVVGTTSDDKTVETTPTNGFWFLFIDDTRSVEKWTKVVGLDKDGRTIEDLSPGVLEGSDHTR